MLEVKALENDTPFNMRQRWYCWEGILIYTANRLQYTFYSLNKTAFANRRLENVRFHIPKTRQIFCIVIIFLQENRSFKNLTFVG